MADRASNTVKGLAGILRLAGTGTQDPPLWARLHELGMPTLVMAGALDTKFAALARRLKDGIDQFATLHLIESAGHSAHLEQPAKFIEAVRHFAIGSPSA